MHGASVDDKCHIKRIINTYNFANVDIVMSNVRPGLRG
jgi:hypothetical protein